MLRALAILLLAAWTCAAPVGDRATADVLLMVIAGLAGSLAWTLGVTRRARASNATPPTPRSERD